MTELIESNPVYTIIWILIITLLVVLLIDRYRIKRKWGDGIPVLTDVVKTLPVKLSAKKERPPLVLFDDE